MYLSEDVYPHSSEFQTMPNTYQLMLYKLYDERVRAAIFKQTPIRIAWMLSNCHAISMTAPIKLINILVLEFNRRGRRIKYAFWYIICKNSFLEIRYL